MKRRLPVALFAAAILALFALAAAVAVANATQPRCSKTDVIACLDHAAVFYGEPAVQLEDLGSCESTDRWWIINTQPAADGEHAEGLTQFLPSTWGTTPYAGRPILSPAWSALAAGWMIHVGRGSEFQCITRPP